MAFCRGTAGIERVLQADAIMWEQLGVEEGQDDWPTPRKCVVCGGSTEGSDWCGSECYQAWNYSPYVDPREEGWF